VFATTFAAALTMFATLWVASLILRDASIVDRFWGIAFLVIASSASAATDGAEPRAHLVLALVGIWGLRLSLHITVRNLGSGEDFRYRAMRRRWGKDFAVASLVSVFALQGAIAWIVSLPVQVAVSSRLPAELTALDFAGLAVWSAGFAIESVADFQLASFKADERNEGVLMDRGLWRYSRHPNYFGDCVVWWGFLLFAGATGAWWTAVGPALMTFLLLRVSGVAMLEHGMRERHDDYDDYCRRTSPFIPLPPRAR
jgi:steroid 5-alpha reductase family enzyme